MISSWTGFSRTTAKGNVQIESLRAFDEKQYKSLISNLP
jgi:uncharacterized protein with GYD domain